jgi:hypothetical protein
MPDGGSVSLVRLRAAVEGRVAARGLRPVARELAMDPRAVTGFLAGAQPRASTRQRLVRQYVRWVAEQERPGDDDAELAALEILLRGLPSSEKDQAWREAVDAVQGIYVRRGLDVPRWIRDTRMPERG